MQLFKDPTGHGVVFFDNLFAPDGTAIAFNPGVRMFETGALDCVNRELIGCNWIAAFPGSLCTACAMTKVSPDPSTPNAFRNWADAEAAKRWVLDNLGLWGWFTASDTGPAPVFNMLAEGNRPVVMGHAQGVVTLSIAEADVVLRTTRREALDERYRTMVGHVRHELAHMLWWRLSVVPDFLDGFRALFGDERNDYAQALKTHYDNGPRADWERAYLTPYAAAHPHEDWAETTAHLLHLVDITDSFLAAGNMRPEIPSPTWKPYRESDAMKVIKAATAIALGANHVNRSMGLQDLYPFVLSGPARDKLQFVHTWLQKGPA